MKKIDRPGARLGKLLVAVSVALMATQGTAHEKTLAAYLTSEDNEPGVAEAEIGETTELDIEIVGAESRQPLAANVRIRIEGSEDSWLPPGVVTRRNGWFSVAGSATIRVPKARIGVEAFHGLTTELFRTVVDTAGVSPASLRIELVHFHRPSWRAGNTHLHLRLASEGPGLKNRTDADRYLRTAPGADGLDLVFVSYLERKGDDHRYISNQFTPVDLAELSRGGPILVYGEELRHNFGAYDEGYGHALLLNIDSLIHPVSFGPGITGAGTDGRTVSEAMREARDRGGAVVWAHNDWGLEDLPGWLFGLIDANNIFDTGHTTGYEEGLYRLLEIGLRVPFSTGTDWMLRDLLRVYVPVDGELTADAWLDGLRAGRSYITSGPLLEMDVEGRGPGEVIELERAGSIRVRGAAIGRLDFSRLEIIFNGRIVREVASLAEGGHYRAEVDTEITVDEPGWLALRIPPENLANEFGETVRAHTSPVYMSIAGAGRFSVEVSRAFAGEMRNALELIDDKAVFADGDERATVRAVYEQAIRILEDGIRKHRSNRR